jgi:hypothetical protein
MIINMSGALTPAEKDPYAVYADKVSPPHANGNTIDFVALMEPIARHLFGAPNRGSKADDLRWGTNGSLSVNPKKGVWHCYESGVGGGALDFVTTYVRDCSDHSEAMDWVRREGILNGSTKPDGNGGISAPLAPAPKVVAKYSYCDENRDVLFQVIRYEAKSFRQCRPDGRGGWVWGLGETRRVPYRLPDLRTAVADKTPFVCIVEGERDVDNLYKLGVPATCNPMGAGKWDSSFNKFFSGVAVVIIQDNDPQSKNDKTGELLFHPDGRPKLPGQDHAQHVAANLHTVASSVKVIDLVKHWPDCPSKGDISDWIETGGGTLEQLIDMVLATADWMPEREANDDTEVTGHKEEKQPDTAIEEWPAPDLSVLQEGRREAPSFPVELLGPFWCEWSKTAAEGANSPVDYAVIPLLAAGARASRKCAVGLTVAGLERTVRALARQRRGVGD